MLLVNMTPVFFITRQLNKWLQLFMGNAEVFDILLLLDLKLYT